MLRPSALEVRQHLMLVATELIEAGAEIRIAQGPSTGVASRCVQAVNVWRGR